MTYSDTSGPAGRRLVGVEAVIDKDLASAMLAADLGADALLIVTDVDAVYAGWGTPQRRATRRATPKAFAGREGEFGSMGREKDSSCLRIRRRDRQYAVIGFECRYAGPSAL